MSNDQHSRKLRFSAHRIAPASAAVGAGLAVASGAMAQVANPDNFDVLLVQSSQIVGNVLANDVGLTQVIPTDAFPGEARIQVFSDGRVRVTPFAGACGAGSSTFSYVATDGVNSANASVTLTYIRRTVPDAYQTSANVAVEGDVQDNDFPSPNATTVIGFSTPAHGSVQQLSGAFPDTGQFRYTPAANYSGPDVFEYQVGSAGLCAPETERVDVLVLPTAAADSYDTPFGTALCGPNVLDNDAGNALSVISVGTPSSGTATISPSGDLCFTPASGFSGTSSFEYEVSDGFGSTSTATVEVVVGNGVPVAVDDAATTVVNVAASGNVLTNDNDPNGDPLSAALLSDPGFGTALLAANGDFTYTPAAGLSGVDSFSYAADDGRGANAIASVVITVNPDAVDDSFSGPYETALSGNVLDNDLGSNLSAELVSGSSDGVVVLSADGSFSFTPNDNFSGASSFVYRANGDDGVSDTATASITIDPAIPTLAIATGGAQSALPGSQFMQQLEVLVQIDGVDAEGVLVCFATVPGDSGTNAILSSAQAVTDANGIARITARANLLPGTLEVRATLCDAPAAGAVTFALSVLQAVSVPVATPAWLALLGSLLVLLGWRRRPD